MKLRALVVDDTVLFRKVVSDALATLPDVEIVGTAPNGTAALGKIRELKPDLVTLDMEMPGLDGIGVLEQLRPMPSAPGVIVLSAHTVRGGKLTMKALELGAFDFLTKPNAVGIMDGRDAIAKALAPLVRAFARRREIRNLLRGQSPTGAPPHTPSVHEPANPSAPQAQAAGSVREGADRLDSVVHRMSRLLGATRPEMIAIGVSTGGPNALAQLLPALPGNLGVPVLIVQHMPPIFTQSLAESLNGKCAIRVTEARDGEEAQPNHAYIAPGGRQMKLVPGPAGERILRITDDPPENNCRPAVDYLFRSLANHFPGRTATVILTGMGSDGTLGLRLMKRHGGLSIAQDEATSVVFGMPKEAIAAGVVDVVAPLGQIAGHLCQALRIGRPPSPAAAPTHAAPGKSSSHPSHHQATPERARP